MTTPPIVTIVGAGRIGRALGEIISTANPEVVCRYWDVRPEARTPGFASIGDILTGSSLVILAVPSTTLPAVMESFRPLAPEMLLLTISKGAPGPTILSSAEWLLEQFPDNPIVVLGGPMMAEELSAERPGLAVIASHSAAAAATCEHLLRSAHITIESSDKPIDVSRAGVLKNIFACTIGMIDGLDLPSPLHRRGHERIREEFFIAGTALGIDQQVMGGPAGLGDFLMTIHSPHSRNRRAGEELLRHQIHDPSAEALHSFPIILDALPTDNSLPILRAAAAIVAGTAQPSTLYQLMSHV